MKYTDKGHIVTVELCVPTADREAAYSVAHKVADDLNERQAIQISAEGDTYTGSAQVRGIEEVRFDFDESGTIIGWG